MDKQASMALNDVESVFANTDIRGEPRRQDNQPLKPMSTTNGDHQHHTGGEGASNNAGGDGESS